MKITIITVTYNSEKYLENTILSVLNQTYKNIEYIIIDGGSTDRTISIIEKYANFITTWISEKDVGIYDAMNKGIRNSTGDVIGFLNSDDIFFDNDTIENIANSFNINIECVFGDIVFVDSVNTNKITRHYSAKNFKLHHFSYGHMPPHPSFYALKTLYEKVGFFKVNYKIAADFDFILRSLLIKKSNYEYLNQIIVRMRSGGISSSIKNKILLNKELLRSCKENNIKSTYFKIYLKYIFKIFSFINHN
jgi:glycosyltransferase involved in cell wall biosynthesis